MTEANEQVVLVTGATNGIGLEASIELARRGAHVVLVGRDPERTESALRQARARAPNAALSSLLCDFSSQAQVRALAQQVRQRFGRLDVLVNNAGTFAQSRTLTEDGLETTFAVNHLGYYLLTRLLEELLCASGRGRVVNVASDAHRGMTLDLDDLGLERDYSLWKAYGRSKLANILFTRELARRWSGRVTVNALHPGVVATGLWNNLPWFLRPLTNAVGRLFFRSPADGARTIVHLAASPEVAGVTGRYFKDEREARISRTAADDVLAARLWEVSERLVGLSAAGRDANTLSV